eukprot:117482-Chlamydomonas_euryale.AAC.1
MASCMLSHCGSPRARATLPLLRSRELRYCARSTDTRYLRGLLSRKGYPCTAMVAVTVAQEVHACTAIT